MSLQFHKNMRLQSKILTVVLGGTLLASCSNIAEDERYIYVKPAEVKRSVLIEDFTGQRCINCPNANDEIATLQEQYGHEAIIAVGIHSGPLGFKGNARYQGLATDLGDTYYYHWGADHQPIGMVNRGGLADYTAWSAQVRKALEQTAPVALQLSPVYDADTHKVNIALHVEGRDGQVDGKLQLWVVEDSIVAMPLATMAQSVDHTFEFVDESGNIVADGSVITVNTLEDDGIDQLMRVPLAVKATSDTDKGGTIQVDASAMPNGSFQICSFGNCISKSVASVFNSSKGALNKATQKSIAAEWIPTDADKTWTATLQLQVVEPEYDDMSEEYVYNKVIADGPKVTIQFAKGQASGIAGVTTTASTLRPVAYYNVAGQRVNGLQEGITIVKGEDGKSYKVQR